MEYRKRRFTVPVAQYDDKHPKAADWDEIFKKLDPFLDEVQAQVPEGWEVSRIDSTIDVKKGVLSVRVREGDLESTVASILETISLYE